MAQQPATKMQRADPRVHVRESPRREVTEEEIRQRAYEIYLNRGAAPDLELENWLQAERELRSKE